MMALCRRPEKNKQRKRKQRMTSNRAFAIRLLNSTNPIIINTHITPERTGREFPLAIVSDLIQGIQLSLLYQSTLVIFYCSILSK